MRMIPTLDYNGRPKAGATAELLQPSDVEFMNKREHRTSMRGKGNAAKDRKMLEVLEQFRVIFRSIKRHYQRVERRAGITGAQLWALSQVASRPGLQVGELARALAIHQSTASNLLRGLEQSQLLSRQRQGKDKDQRAVQLVPTAKGRAVLKRAPQPLIGVLQQALTELPSRNLDGLHEQLGVLIGCMEREGAAAPSIPISELYKEGRKRR